MAKKKDNAKDEEEKETLEDSSEEAEDDEKDSDAEPSEEEADEADDSESEESSEDDVDESEDEDEESEDEESEDEESEDEDEESADEESKDDDAEEEEADEESVETASAKKGGKKKSGKKSKDTSDEPRTEPKRPKKSSSDPDEVSDDLRDLFGLAEEGSTESPSDYTPEERTGVSIGSLVGLLVILGILGGLVYFAVIKIREREDDLEEQDRQAKLAAEEAKEPSVRYGNIALMASTPSNALILKNGEPIYAKTASGAWTELRAGPSTRIQNIKIKEGETIKYTLVSEGYKPYEIELSEYDWVPIPGTGDFEKVYHNIRMEPEERPFLLNCDAIKAADPKYAPACDVSVTDEIRTRQDYERIYDTRLNGTLKIESDPPGAKIFYLTEPLMKADGTQATTPYEFMVYGKIEAGEDEGKDKKIKITDDLSVRLELDGYEPYIAEIKSHQWKCDPISSADELEKIEVPEKIEKEQPDMFHHLCTYSYSITGKLFEPGKGPGQKPKGEGDDDGEGGDSGDEGQ